MPQAGQYDRRELTDWMFSFPEGMNAGIAPALLDKQQLSFLTNGTLRGDFAYHRPPFRKMALTFDSTTSQNNFQTAKFQGAGMFNPITAPDCMLVSIGGNIFQVTPGQTNGATVSNANPPNDFNPASPNQVWIFQTERWAIINDGQSIPMISDGITTRRANSGGFLLTVQNNSDPNVGSTYNSGTAVLTPAASATGPLYAGSSGQCPPPGIPPSIIQYSWPTGLAAGSTILFACSGTTPTVGQQFFIGQDLWTVTSAGTWKFSNTTPCDHGVTYVWFKAKNTNVLAGGTSYANNQTIYAAAVATTTGLAPFVVPSIANQATVRISQQYLANVPGPLFINGQAYEVLSVGGVPYPPVNVLPEMPPGKMGCNSGGRTWIALPDGKSYIASDLTGDQSSGTGAFNFTDAVLHFTENTLLAGGGAFRIPSPSGNITAMVSTETMDASLGQGPIEVFSPTQVFSCNAPTDRTTWQTLTYPIQSVSLLGAGAMSQWSTISSNSDTLFRSMDGIRSLVLARRDFNVWGNVPNSEEITPIMAADDQTLLAFSSAINFDNRAIFTANPQQATQGVYHNRLIAINFDPVSSLAGKTASIYDGIWTGLNVLQLVTGTFEGVQRAFAFVLNVGTSTIELWEILTSPPDPDFLPINELSQWSDPSNHFDNSTTAIPLAMIGPIMDFGQKNAQTREYLRLDNGEIYVDHMSGTVQFEVWYKPDDYPLWTLWLRWTDKATDPTAEGLPQFRPRMGIGTPSGDVFDTTTNRPLREGYLFQIKVIIIGNARFKGAKFGAIVIPQAKYAEPNSKPLLTPGP